METLLAELDEVATKQAEDEAKKNVDDEIRSSRSKKSVSSFDQDGKSKI